MCMYFISLSFLIWLVGFCFPLVCLHLLVWLHLLVCRSMNIIVYLDDYIHVFPDTADNITIGTQPAIFIQQDAYIIPVDESEVEPIQASTDANADDVTDADEEVNVDTEEDDDIQHVPIACSYCGIPFTHIDASFHSVVFVLVVV